MEQAKGVGKKKAAPKNPTNNCPKGGKNHHATWANGVWVKLKAEAELKAQRVHANFFESIVNDEIENIEKKFDVKFVFTKTAQFLTIIYTYFDERKTTASNFAIKIAAIIDTFNPNSKIVFKNTMNAESNRLNLRLRFVFETSMSRVTEKSRQKSLSFSSVSSVSTSFFTETTVKMFKHVQIPPPQTPTPARGRQTDLLVQPTNNNDGRSSLQNPHYQ